MKNFSLLISEDRAIRASMRLYQHQQRCEGDRAARLFKYMKRTTAALLYSTTKIDKFNAEQNPDATIIGAVTRTSSLGQVYRRAQKQTPRSFDRGV